MRRPTSLRGTVVVAIAGMLTSCGNDTVAGKTTTTSNGGGGIVAVGPDGRPLPGCVAYAARTWDTAAGLPGIVDTLLGDSTGTISLSSDSYAFLEIRNGQQTLGAWTKRVVLLEGSTRTISLDSLSRLQGSWADRSSIPDGSMFLDSTFRSVALQNDGSFDFEKLPAGNYALMLRPGAGSSRPMGDAQVHRGDVRYTGSGNIVLDGDSTGSPLWIDDFESGGIRPMLHSSYPAASPWFVWASDADLRIPASVKPDSIHGAIGPDSTRTGSAFHARFAPTGPYSQVGVGLTNLEIDLRARGQVCFGYRADAPLKLEFQRDSVSGIRPTLSSTLPPHPQWIDTCVATSALVPNSDTPDSLATWNAFAKRVLVIQFSASNPATFLDLDDIRLR